MFQEKTASLYLTSEAGEAFTNPLFLLATCFAVKPSPEAPEIPLEGGRSAEVWISPDPARQFHSPYLYTGNGANPINMVDKDGQWVGPLLAAGVAGGLGWLWLHGVLKTDEALAGQTQQRAQELMDQGDIVGSATEIMKVGEDKSKALDASIGTGKLLLGVVQNRATGRPVTSDAVGTGVQRAEQTTEHATKQLTDDKSFLNRSLDKVKGWFGPDEN